MGICSMAADMHTTFVLRGTDVAAAVAATSDVAVAAVALAWH